MKFDVKKQCYSIKECSLVKFSSQNFKWNHYSELLSRWGLIRPQYTRYVILLPGRNISQIFSEISSNIFSDFL